MLDEITERYYEVEGWTRNIEEDVFEDCCEPSDGLH